ncbi:TPA_exp: Integral membrane protein [Trichophyton benhamiae CBS 112371]|uniref:Integral membrane protein n=1 Tax=Arthroderma benhamiae (strain ATCC MYA-4681 / CBS 112371) TaxID=663331 RepID=D4APQ7_ARTBC|nr:uncharacterized protein ARB_06225 [Trichophyton benhamiae CBS 112371]EFE35268.1 integral membrane protein [Trichophyton benhamiae CBS 112371]DAA78147.1 TPA_exp: Integral membrane protein [Trichophyton benhamiae CBS 112371]
MILPEEPPDGDVNKGHIIIILTWTGFSISLLLVIARIWTRVKVVRAFGWDDGFIILALACAVVNAAMVTTSIAHGTGRHQFYLTKEQAMQADKYNWISQGFHVASTNWAKVSIMLFLLRIIGHATRQAPYFYGGMVFLSVVNFVCIFTIYGQCMPVESLWDHSIKGKCWNPRIQRDFAFFTGAVSAASDLALAIYPVRLISKLQMPFRVKLGLAAIFALGFVAVGASVVKTIFLSRLSARADYSWNTIDLVFWLCIEQYLIMIAACIPMLGPLVKLILREATSRATGSSGSTSWPRSMLRKPATRRKPRPYWATDTSLYGTKEEGTTIYGVNPNMKTRCYPLNSYHSGVEQQTTTESQEAIVQGADGQRDAIVKVSEVHVKIESLEPDRRSSRSVTFESSAMTSNVNENTQKSKSEKIEEVPV